jgi:hypothetical protein
LTISEREEIEMLKQEIKEMKEYYKQKEKKHTLSQERLRSALEDVNIRNEELLEEIKILEVDKVALQQKLNMNQDEKLKKTRVTFRTTSPMSYSTTKSPVNRTNPGFKINENTPPTTRTTTTRVPSKQSPLSPSNKSLVSHRSPLSQISSARIHPETRKPVTQKEAQPDNSLHEVNTSQSAPPDIDNIMYKLESRLGLPRHIKQIDTPLKTQRIYSDATILEVYKGGATKLTLPNGHIQYWFPNGDNKILYPNGSEILEIYTFKSGVKIKKYIDVSEEHFVDGQVVSRFPDGNIKIQFPDGLVVWQYPDGREEVSHA